ncbi:MAG: PDZ domain-containing protein [Myxococcales bacterium]|nr:PDZ domain-containing protein [Myxococcales bacterium]
MAELRVPDRYDGAVMVTHVEPDSPADEVFLQVGDVIVEAQYDRIRTAGDLESVVGARDYSKVTFIRDGTILQVVLQKPFVP